MFAPYNCQNVSVVKMSVIKMSHRLNKAFVTNSTLKETETEIFDPIGQSLLLAVLFVTSIYLKVSFANK